MMLNRGAKAESLALVTKSSSQSINSGSENLQFSLVILCYKAEESIIEFVERTQALLSWLNLRYEILLVGNYWPNSGDRTPGIVKKLAEEKEHIRAITRPKEGAMGWDLKSGFAEARGEFVGFIDGDGQFPIDSILPPLYHALANDYDLCKTYRVVREDGPFRALISFVFNSLFRSLFGTTYRDVNSKPKIIRRPCLQAMELESSDWFIDAEIMIKAHQLGLKVIELPIHFVENKNRASFVQASAIIEFFKNLYEFRFRRTPCKPYHSLAFKESSAADTKPSEEANPSH